MQEVYKQREAQLKEALRALVDLQEATIDSRLCNLVKCLWQRSLMTK